MIRLWLLTSFVIIVLVVPIRKSWRDDDVGDRVFRDAALLDQRGSRLRRFRRYVSAKARAALHMP